MSYLCIRISEFPAQALLSLRTELHQQPVAVLQHESPFEQVCSMNARALRLGVRHSMKRTDIDAIAGVLTLRRSANEEQSLRNALLMLMGQTTPRVEEMSGEGVCCMVLDLAGTQRLFGESLQIAIRLQQQMRALHVEAAFCSSFHLHTALIVARTLRCGSTPVSIAAGQERGVLAALPLRAIDPQPEQAETFASWGIRTIGQLAALPVDELIARMGQPAQRLHALATATLPHLFRPLESVDALEAHAELEDSIELAESLLFVLGPMLDRLIALVIAKALGLLAVQVLLTLESQQQHTIAVRPALPSTDRKFLLKLLQLELAAHPPPTAVVGITLTGEPALPAQEQGGLFSPQLPEASRLDVTLARIQSIVGGGNVGCARLQDTPAPEGFTIQPFRVRAVAHIDPGPPISPRIACRTLRPPWQAQVTQQASRPSFIACEHQRFHVKHAYGPWLSSGTWWNHNVWSREEWEVILVSENAPMPLHALLVHDLVAMVWRLEGFYD